MTTGVVVASGLLIVTGLLALFGLFLFLWSGIAANRDQDVMYSELRKQLALATVPVNGAIPTGTPIGIVQIPRLRLEQVFVEGSASEQTIHGPGLRHDTVLPGQAGASVLVVRPGFVHSKMTAGLPAAPLSTTPEVVADATVKALRSGRRTVWAPGALRWVFVVFRHLPGFLWRRLER